MATSVSSAPDSDCTHVFCLHWTVYFKILSVSLQKYIICNVAVCDGYILFHRCDEYAEK